MKSVFEFAVSIFAYNVALNSFRHHGNWLRPTIICLVFVVQFFAGLIIDEIRKLGKRQGVEYDFTTEGQ